MRDGRVILNTQSYLQVEGPVLEVSLSEQLTPVHRMSLSVQRESPEVLVDNMSEHTFKDYFKSNISLIVPALRRRRPLHSSAVAYVL